MSDNYVLQSQVDNILKSTLEVIKVEVDKVFDRHQLEVNDLDDAYTFIDFQRKEMEKIEEENKLLKSKIGGASSSISTDATKDILSYIILRKNYRKFDDQTISDFKKYMSDKYSTKI